MYKYLQKANLQPLNVIPQAKEHLNNREENSTLVTLNGSLAIVLSHYYDSIQTE